MSKRKRNNRSDNTNDPQQMHLDPIKYERLKNARKYFQFAKEEQRFMKDTFLREGLDLDPHRGERRIEAVVNKE